MIEWNIEGVPTQVIGEDVDHRTEPSTTPITSFPEFLISYASVPVADQFEELLDQGRFVLQPIWGATEPLVFVLKEPRQWNTWDGGGGYGIGARFAVYGTLGQPDAGRMSGSRFALNGGFWNRAVAVQQPGLPVLSITRGTGNFIIHWDPESPGFILQVSDSLTSPNWIDVSGNPTSPATVPDDGVLKFYRLRKP